MPVTKSAKTSKTVKSASLSKEVENIANAPLSEEPKKRGRAKKQPPTKEEQLQMLKQVADELKVIIQELKDDELKVASLLLKKVPELIKETLKNLEEDLEEVEEKQKEVSEEPSK